jgi:hypothetical protein
VELNSLAVAEQVRLSEHDLANVLPHLHARRRRSARALLEGAGLRNGQRQNKAMWTSLKTYLES